MDMRQEVRIAIGRDALEQLLDFGRTLPSHPFTLIYDTNTYAALGQRVEAAIREADHDVTSILLTGEEVIADEKYLTQVLVQSPPGDQTYVAVGSGTITDIARYISYRTRNSFISVPTAPSVDGFMSTGAPLVVGGIKETYKAQAPIAVFADLQTSIAAPRELKAAGLGDMVGKLTSLADWRLGHLVWDEPYDEAIERRVRAALESCVTCVDDIVQSGEQGVYCLMAALIESGVCMFEFGDSRPASGSEHHCSHFWEMQLLKRHRPAILHGAKVGYATTLIAKVYERVRQWSREDVAALLRSSRFVAAQAAEIEGIRRVYGPVANDVIRMQKPFLEMTEPQFDRLQRRILENWEEFQGLASTVPPSAQILGILNQAGAPTHWQDLPGIEEADIGLALLYGHYLRNRFTVLKLMQVCGVDVRSLV
jgi:glycerol-1-phosphate dehydrogenase [NAD(P)+]